MTERRSSADLGPRAEEALASFPVPDRDWDSDVLAVQARLSESIRSNADAAWLTAPLPREPGEPTSHSAATTPLASSGVRTQSLADLARRSVERQKAAERAEMARESLALAAQSRPNAEEARALREAVSSVRTVEAPQLSTPAAAAPATRAAAAPVSTRMPAQNSWSRIGLATAALALAAGALLWLKRPTEPAPLIGSAESPDTAQAKAEAAPVPAQLGAAAKQANALPTPDTAATAGIDPSTLSQEGSKTADRGHAKALGSAGLAPASSAALGPSPEKIVLDDDAPSRVAAAAPPAAPAEKPVEKSLPPDPALRPADSTGGAIPVKPSTGAVQAALGAVMSGARHCVAGDGEASSAIVIFSSDGYVQTVSVSGPAAGKPSGACIQAQLSRARVQPFATESFSISATVRPD